MEITRNYSGTLYHVEDIRGNIVCSFFDLKTAVLVKRFIEGHELTEEETNHAIGAIELHDEEEERLEAEREARKATKAAAQKEGAAE